MKLNNLKKIILIIFFSISNIVFANVTLDKINNKDFKLVDIKLKDYKFQPIPYNFTVSQLKLLDSIQYKSFLYFINEINPDLGLVKDRSADYSPASIAATGFGVVVWIIGAENGWISRDKAAQLTLNLVRFLYNSEQSAKPDATGYKGFYYHFIDIKNGKRTWESELSTIDTALLIAGLRIAANYFNQNNSIEKEIRDKINFITKRVQWDWMIIREGKYKNTVGMGWYPENGFHDMGWKGYNEALILYIIAAGTNLSNSSEIYQAWLDGYEWIDSYGLIHAAYPSLFVHQYSHMFIDFRNITDTKLFENKIDYFENSKRATLIQQKYAIENPNKWVGYDSLTWGFTACDGPGDSYNTNDRKFYSYAARGTSGPKLTFFDDGTIAPTAPGGSIIFAPEVCMQTLENIFNKYDKQGVWGKFGFVDSFNPTLNWFAKDHLAIDQGPFVIMIQNLKNGLIWKLASKDEIFAKGFKNIKQFKKIIKK